jgi:hypothetical protein
MATSLRNTLNQMATQFATGVINAIRAASLEEILAETGGATGRGVSAASLNGGGRRGRKGRLERRSAQDISKLVERIVALLSSKPRGLRAEQIREELGLEAKELPRPIAEALAANKVSKTGQKRATTYFAKGGGGRGAARGAKKAKASGRKRRKGAGKKVGKKAAPALSAVNGSPTG